MHDSLVSLFNTAIAAMCKSIDANRGSKHLAGIGIISSDSMDSVGASLLFDGDFTDTSETYQKLSPVEWSSSHEASFKDLNVVLKNMFEDVTPESQLTYKERVEIIYDSCAQAFEQLDLKTRYRDSLYITFSGADPNDTLIEMEKVFVRRMNSISVFKEWCSELG